jgi:hypothetical protein
MGIGFFIWVILALIWKSIQLATLIAIPIGAIVFLSLYFIVLKRSSKKRFLSWMISGLTIVIVFIGFIVGQVIIPLFLNYSTYISSNISSGPELTGIWVPTEDTLKFMQESGYQFSNHRIEFKSDGALTMTNIPEKWLFINNPGNQVYFTGDGTWTSSEQKITDFNNIQLVVQINNPQGISETIQFGSILQTLYFYPGNIHTNTIRIHFQKCFPVLHISDPILLPLVNALNMSNRDSIGFSPINSTDRIELDGSIGDNVLGVHIYSDFVDRYIFFRNTNNGYVWVSEQESYDGPLTWIDPDSGPVNEFITLNYETENRNGGPLNKLLIYYTGPDTRLNDNPKYFDGTLNLEDIRPILEEWKQWRESQPPSPQSLCP